MRRWPPSWKDESLISGRISNQASAQMYDQIAEYYDWIHQSLTADLDLIVRLAAQNTGPILEMGCGTGRLLLPLARLGNVIVGVDNSKVMLSLAQSKIAKEQKAVQNRVELVYADMINFEISSNFGLILYSHNTLMHLNRHQLKRSLERSAQNCSPGGMVFLDIENPIQMIDPSEDDLVVLENVYIDEDKQKVVQQFSSSWIDQDSQSRHVTWMLDEFPAAGGSLQRSVVRFTMNYYYSHELIELLENLGLTISNQFGDYEGGAYGEDSDRLIIIAKSMQA
jgi:ubiquinone/menaquinone biosynthesis C-methylase UbiE